MKTTYTKWLSVILALMLLSLATLPALALESSSTLSEKTADVINTEKKTTRRSARYAEATQSPTATLNDITDNPELAELSGLGLKAANESCNCYWVTDASGEYADTLVADEIYTYHLYLRCSGQSGASVRDVNVTAFLESETACPWTFRGGFDIRYTNELNQRYQLVLNDVRLHGLLRLDCYPKLDSTTVKTLDGAEIVTTGDLFNEKGLYLSEINNGLEHAVEITFEFTTQEHDHKATTTTTSTTSMSATAPPKTPPTDTPQVEVITLDEVDNLEIARKELYTEETLPEANVMNSVTDNPEWGDEREFLQITNLTTGESSREAMVLESGYLYEVEIYLRNDNANNRSYLQATLNAPLPLQLKAGEASEFTAAFRSTDAAPSLISTTLRLISRDDLVLKYLQDSAAQTCGTKKTTISDYQTLLTKDYSVGSVYGSLKNAKHITYTIAAVAKTNGERIDDGEWVAIEQSFQDNAKSISPRINVSPVGDRATTDNGPVAGKDRSDSVRIISGLVGISVVAWVFYCAIKRRPSNNEIKSQTKADSEPQDKPNPESGQAQQGHQDCQSQQDHH